MPTPPRSYSQELNIVTLKEYIDTKIEAINEATKVSNNSMNIRLEGMNEFRNQLRDQNATFITRAEFNVFKERIEEDIKFLRESRSKLEGKAEQSSVVNVMVISIIGLLISIVSLLLRFLGI